MGSSIGEIWANKMKGASFCHVAMISPVVKSKPWRTSGSQKWAGARPSLSARAIVVIVSGRGSLMCVISHCPAGQALRRLANRIIAAAIAWTKKYLVAASTVRG